MEAVLALMKVIPPNFGYVEEGIFRCGAPEPRHFGFIASLHLKTCILLTDTHDMTFIHWMQESGVTIFCPIVEDTNFSTAKEAPLGSREAVQLYQTAPERYSGTASGQGGSSAAATGATGSRAAGRPPPHAAGHTGGASGGSSAVLPSGSGGAGGAATAGLSSGVGGANQGVSTAVSSGSGGGGGVPVLEDAGGGAEAGDGDGPLAATQNTSGDGGDVEVEWRGTPDDGSAVALNPPRGGHRPLTRLVPDSTASTSNAARFLKENITDRTGGGSLLPTRSTERLPFSVARGVYDATSIVLPERRQYGLMTLSEAVVVGILHLMLDPTHYPLLITCSKGRYRTGIVCGCLRKLQRWNLVSILEEYRRFASDKSRADNEEFIELFDKDLVSLELPGGRKPTILYDW